MAACTATAEALYLDHRRWFPSFPYHGRYNYSRIVCGNGRKRQIQSLFYYTVASGSNYVSWWLCHQAAGRYFKNTGYAFVGNDLYRPPHIAFYRFDLAG